MCPCDGVMLEGKSESEICVHVPPCGKNHAFRFALGLSMSVAVRLPVPLIDVSDMNEQPCELATSPPICEAVSSKNMIDVPVDFRNDSAIFDVAALLVVHTAEPYCPVALATTSAL